MTGVDEVGVFDFEEEALEVVLTLVKDGRLVIKDKLVFDVVVVVVVIPGGGVEDVDDIDGDRCRLLLLLVAFPLSQGRQ